MLMNFDKSSIYQKQLHYHLLSQINQKKNSDIDQKFLNKTVESFCYANGEPRPY